MVGRARSKAVEPYRRDFPTGETVPGARVRRRWKSLPVCGGFPVEDVVGSFFLEFFYLGVHLAAEHDAVVCDLCTSVSMTSGGALAVLKVPSSMLRW
jgi:hypothetical protein